MNRCGSVLIFGSTDNGKVEIAPALKPTAARDLEPRPKPCQGRRFKVRRHFNSTAIASLEDMCSII